MLRRIDTVITGADRVGAAIRRRAACLQARRAGYAGDIGTVGSRRRDLDDIVARADEAEIVRNRDGADRIRANVPPLMRYWQEPVPPTVPPAFTVSRSRRRSSRSRQRAGIDGGRSRIVLVSTA